MRILIVTPYLPWPLDAGGKVAQFSTLQCLSQDHKFTLICPVYSQQQLDEAKELANYLPNLQIRAVPLFRPPVKHPKWYVFAHTVFYKIRQFLHPLVDDSKSVNDIHSSRSPYYPFTPLPVELIEVIAQELDAGVDLLQVEFADMLSLGHWKYRNVPKLFIHHQIHWVYTQRYVEVQEYVPYADYLATLIYADEVSSLSAFDGIVVFSQTDAKELSQVINPHLIHVSPFPIPGDVKIVETPAPILNPYFVFIGSEEHYPNQDGLQWLLTNIWSLIRHALPQARLSVIGPWSEKWRSIHETEGVDYPGFVQDLSAHMQGTIQLVPIRIGSGIRTKILAGMAQGVPVVSTSIGAEGLQVNDNEHLLLRDHADAFAEASINLANNPELSSRLATKALEVIQTYYSPEQVCKTRNEIYKTVIRQAVASSHNKCSYDLSENVSIGS